MKKIFSMTLVALALFASTTFAQVSAPAGSTPVSQTATMLNAATNVQHSHTTATTLTLNPGGNFYVYIDGIDISNCATGTAVTAAAPTYITTTGITGSPQYQIGSGVTAGLCQPAPNPYLTTPLKSSTAGSSVTFILPTFATNQVVSLNVYYHVSAQ